ncbi:response regulator transcription factor [Paraburkholderia sediminicola]|uniref:response regulator transcription factor n=1 Tax=Paraburkholderia sediminicola TaxID=458836 RepID=UPI0038BC8D51
MSGATCTRIASTRPPTDVPRSIPSALDARGLGRATAPVLKSHAVPMKNRQLPCASVRPVEQSGRSANWLFTHVELRTDRVWERSLRPPLAAVRCQRSTSERKPKTPNFESQECPDDSTGSQRGRFQNGAPVRVLVVDDSRPSADALSAYLQAGGMSVRTVYHGSDALREAKAWIPDCIVLDVAMCPGRKNHPIDHRAPVSGRR